MPFVSLQIVHMMLYWSPANTTTFALLFRYDLQESASMVYKALNAEACLYHNSERNGKTIVKEKVSFNIRTWWAAALLAPS